MLRPKLARAVIEDLRGKIAVAEERKKDVVSYYNYIHSKYKDHEMAHEEFVFLLEKEFDGRTLDEWIKYYDSYISYLEGELEKKTGKITNRKALVCCR